VFTANSVPPDSSAKVPFTATNLHHISVNSARDTLHCCICLVYFTHQHPWQVNHCC